MLESSPEFDAVVATLGSEVRRSQMMGYPSITRDGKMIACFDTRGLSVKLGAVVGRARSCPRYPGSHDLLAG